MALASALFPGAFNFFDDMFLVAMVLSGSYILFLLYMSFRENQVIFAVASVVAITVLVMQPGIVTLLLILLFFFVFFGQQLQMLLQFSIYPLLGLVGIRPPNPFEPAGAHEAEEMMHIEQKLLRGEQVSEMERTNYAKNMQAQSQQQQQVMMSRNRMR